MKVLSQQTVQKSFKLILKSSKRQTQTEENLTRTNLINLVHLREENRPNVI